MPNILPGDNYWTNVILGRTKSQGDTTAPPLGPDGDVSEPPVNVPRPPDFTTPPAPFQGFTPKHAMEGFDFNREQDVAKSAKDAFAWLANQAPPPPLQDKNALMVWFATYIKPGMEKLGHHVTDVQGDKFRFNNWQGDFWVDYGRGAGADNGALAWQADYANGGPGNQAYNQTQQAITKSPRQSNFTKNAVTGVPDSYGTGGPDMANYYQYLQEMMR